MKKILFVCVENSCRSQIAEGLLRSLGHGAFEVYSAGSKPSGVINPDAIKVMSDIGIDITAQSSKGFNDLGVRKFDYVITLGCNDTCPFVPAEQHIQWDIPDPKNKDFSFFQAVRDEIKTKILDLLATIKADAD